MTVDRKKNGESVASYAMYVWINNPKSTRQQAIFFVILFAYKYTLKYYTYILPLWGERKGDK